MQNVFFGNISVTFFRQNYHSHRSSQSFQSLEISFGLQGKSSRIIVGFAVYQQHRFFHFFCIHKRRHGVVHIRCFPVISLLALETKRSERSVVSTASGKDRKSTRLNSSHVKISYAVFCLKKKTNAEKE